VTSWYPKIAAVRWATGRDMTGFDVVAAVPAAVSGIREELHRYFGLPFYRAMFSAAAYDAASGDQDAQLAAISERFVFDLCAIGDGPTVAQVLDRYRQAGAANPMITASVAPTSNPRCLPPPSGRRPCQGHRRD
jgi:hypothetical protein